MYFTRSPEGNIQSCVKENGRSVTACPSRADAIHRSFSGFGERRAVSQVIVIGGCDSTPVSLKSEWCVRQRQRRVSSYTQSLDGGAEIHLDPALSDSPFGRGLSLTK
ncbi:hypothetical protein EYF80_047804 [Liparis tanakae]|uniref:Uncharacterized protein n=1 Tax=Liparis tanakae TaxID=230148 RepID=A0A4Z2FME3_9TELE|nr:hypothetical protein EYF80_047804 [Liparis tanakae]